MRPTALVVARSPAQGAVAHNLLQNAVDVLDALHALLIQPHHLNALVVLSQLEFAAALRLQVVDLLVVQLKAREQQLRRLHLLQVQALQVQTTLLSQVFEICEASLAMLLRAVHPSHLLLQDMLFYRLLQVQQ